MKRIKIILFLAISLAIFSCNDQATPVEDEQNEDQISASDDGMLRLSQQQLNYADIVYGKFDKQLLADVVQARGELILPVNAMADIICLYPGTVQQINVNRGEPVRKGQVLAIINSTDFIEAQQNYLMVKNQISMLEKEYERQKELNKDKISSDKYFQKSLSDYNVAQAELQGLSLQLKMAGISFEKLDAGEIISGLSIVSTLNGFVKKIDANPGKYIQPDESIFQVIDRKNLLMELNVFEKDILKVIPGQRITFSLANMDQMVHQAEIVSVGNSVQEEARVVKVLASFNNNGGRLLPGMFVSAEIHTGESEVDALPDGAVLRIGNDEYIIFYTTPELQTEEGTSFIAVPVIPGNTVNGFIEIEALAPIPSEALIVIKGGYYLKTEKARQEE